MRSHPLAGILLKVGQTLSFSLMYVAIRLAGPVPVGEVVFFRAFFAFVPLFAFALFTVGPRGVFRTQRPMMHVLRGLTGVLSMFLNFAAVKLVPLAEFTGLSFVMPIFAVVLAPFLLRERVGPYRSFAVVVGFAGVVMMVEPHGGLLNLLAATRSSGAALALGGALLAAFVVIFIRQMSATEKSETIVFYFMTITAITGGLTMIWWRVPLTPIMAFWLVMSGLLGGLGQICMTFSYRYAEPSLLAPFDYAAMIWAIVLGFAVFGEVPETLVIAGALVITAAGIFIAWREGRLLRLRTSTS